MKFPAFSFSGLVVFAAGLFAASSAHAAPPKADFLFPAGAARGAMATITASGSFDKWPVQVWTDRADVKFTPAEKKGEFTVTVTPEAIPGVCWVRLYNDEGAASLRPFIVGALPEITEAEPNNEPLKPQTLDTANVTINGKFEKSGDADVFAVALKKGQTLVASMDANRTFGSPLDGVLQILSPAGFVLELNDDDHGLDPQIVFPVPADGTYFVRTFCFPAMPDSTIGLAGKPGFVYRLTLTTGGFADHAFPLAISRTSPGETAILGWNLPDNLRLPVAVANESPRASLLPPGTANAVPVSVEPHPTVVEAEPNDAAHPQRVEFPVTISGHIGEPRDVDTFAFTAKKGEPLLIVSESRSLGFPLDPVVTVSDAAGKTLSRTDDSGKADPDPDVAFTPPSDGEFHVSITDLHRRGGMRFAYRLSIIRSQPDFALSVAADAFLLTPGKPLEIPITIDRQRGFSQEIELTAAGLPEGVTAAPVKSEPKGDSAKTVKLVLNSTTGPHAIPLRIVGTSSAEPKVVHTPLAALTGLNERTEHLWLTVLPAPAK